MQPEPHITPAKRGASVTLANAVIQSAQQLTLNQKRLLMLCLSRINPRSKALPEKPTKISAEEFAEAFGLSARDGYRDLKRASDGLLARHVSRQRGEGRHVVVERYAWLSRADYATGEGWIAIKFNAEIAPYLIDLKKRFTTYQLSQASSLRSLYSWRMLEHFEMFSATGWWQVDLSEFQTVMDVPDSYRENFAQTRRWVIEPAVEELKAKDGWVIEWKPIKVGRKVQALRFEFHKDLQGQLL